MRRIGAALLVTAGLACLSGQAVAGPYSDELGKCLVGSTSADDKATLVKWVFAIAALHPSVGSVSAVNDVQRTQLDKEVAGLFEALITDRCRKQTQNAVRYEGEKTIGMAFEVLGQAAMVELFSNPDVAKGLGGFAEHMDKKKFDQLLGKPAGD